MRRILFVILLSCSTMLVKAQSTEKMVAWANKELSTIMINQCNWIDFISSDNLFSAESAKFTYGGGKELVVKWADVTGIEVSEPRIPGVTVYFNPNSDRTCNKMVFAIEDKDKAALWLTYVKKLATDNKAKLKE
jgi:hypothetical protein